MKKSAFKNRIKSFFGKHKTTIFVVALSFQLAIGLTIYFLFGRISPNDNIFVPEEGSVAFLMNENPKFSVDFGKVKEPDKQWVRFEAQTSNDNPFEEGKSNIFTKIAKFFQKKERYGIEMSLVGVDLKGEELKKYADEVVLVADVIGTDSVKTSTELIDVGREIGVYEDQETPVSKQTVLNKNVADGVDLEYQILKGLGLKEEIIIRDLEAYKDSCKEKGCSLPVNEFVFDLKMDSDVELKEGWFTVDGQSTNTYYFVDSKGRYIAHFLPNFAIDNINNKTFDVNLKVEKGEGNNYRAKVTVDLEWLLSSERVFPVRIDPSIVHDDTADFSGGVFKSIESVTGPKVQIDLEGYNAGLDCSGGIEITESGYKIHVFKADGTLTCNSYGSAEVLVVGGGGGGGANYGNGGNSGGGAGGLVHESSFGISGSVSVTVGGGGAAGSSGSDSVFSSLTAEGGGVGAYSTAGGDGGSGGGGNPGGSGSQGGDGGQSYNAGNVSGGGGGGGAGGNGEDSGTVSSTDNGGDGGVGSSEYSYLLAAAGIGEEVSGMYYIAGGGGGGDYGDPADSSTSGAGGYGGGGNRADAGAANTGGGGGGACEYPASTNFPGGAGGSGVVVVRYSTAPGRSSGEYISSSIDMGGSISEATLSWTPSGVNTGNGETPYSTTGLVAQWNLNETSGTTADNTGSCGATCDGTLTNFASTGSQDAADGTGWTSVSKRCGTGALMFDGSNDYVSVGDLSQLELTNVSVASWVKVVAPQVGVYRRVAGKYDNAAFQGYQLAINGTNGGGPYFQIGNGTSVVGAQSPDYSVFDGEWHHLVGTYDGTDLKIYVDGIERGTNTSSAISYGTETFCIGGNCSTAILNAVIDSTTVYSRALSASEVLSNYQAGNIEFQYRVSADNSTWSSWTSYGTSASDLAWESFDEPYLYNTDTTGLTGYWPMEETSGSSVADVVGSSSGTATGTTIVDGLYGKGRNLNGTSDYISMSDSDTFYFGANNFTIDMWVYLTNTTTASHGLYSQYVDSNNRIFWGIDTTGMQFFAISGGTTLANYSGVHGISANTWAHIAVVRDGTSLIMYVNGTGIDYIATTGIASNSLPNLSISPRWGSAYFNSAWRYLSGYMDEIRLSSTAFSASDVEASWSAGFGRSDLVHLKGDSVIKSEGDGSRRIIVGNGDVDKNTVALWHLDERGGSGAYIKDSSPSGLHGTPTGTVYSNSGKVGGARYYDSGTTRIDIADPAPAALNFTTTAFTVEAWINVDNYNSARYITNCDNGTVGWGFSVNTSGQLRLTTRGTTDNETVGTTVLATGQWYHVAAVFTGTAGERSLYINGSLEASEKYTGSITTSTVAFTLGNRSTTYYRGSLDEIRISNIARTAEEISESYMIGKATFVNKAVEERDLSSLTTLPIDIAGDRPGSYLNVIWGEEEYFNSQPDINTVGLWHLDTEGKGVMYMDSSKNSNHGITTYYGMRYGILSSNLTMIMNQLNGAANNYEMDITCTGGNSACQITTSEGVTISTPTINYGVAGQESAANVFIMYSPSLSGQGITAYSNNSQNYIKVQYSSGWQYDNNTSWVSFTPRVSNILVASAVWGTSVTLLESRSPISSEGVVNSAMEFDGSNDIITVPDSTSLDMSSSFTVEAWIKPNSLPSVSDSGGGIVTKGGAGDASANNHNYWLSLCYGSTWAGNTGDGYSFGFEDSAGSNYYATIDETLLVDSWHYLVGVFADNSNELRLYHNGQLVKTTTGVTATPNIQAIDLTIGGMTLADHVGYFDGIIDEVRISNTNRTSWEIREAYEMGLRTHSVNIDFGASLVSGNLITGSGDTSFSIDATVYGLEDLGSALYVGEKVIVKENYDGTEYLAQGTVSAITESTGAVTVSSWDSGSTFPSAGYTVNADVFKWQREYIPIKNRTLSYQVNATNLLTFNITNGDEGRNIWIDDLRSTSGYLSGYTGENLTFPSSGQYFQYKAIFNTWDSAVTPYISQVQLDYEAAGPTMDQVMRHGKWFDSSGVKQPFWWVNTP